MEEELNLFNRTIAGVAYWPALRPYIAHAFAARFGLFDPAASGWRNSAAVKTWHYLSRFVTDLNVLPWTGYEPVDTILIPHRRKLVRGGRVIDVISDRVLHEPEFGRILLLEQARHPHPDNGRSSLVVRQRPIVESIAQVRARLTFRKFRTAFEREYCDLSGVCRKELGIAFPIGAATLALRFAIFWETRALARKIFERARPRRLLIVNANGNPAYVAAAKERQLPVIELQHGMISAYHLGYSYPTRPAISLAPDYLLTFGPFWADAVVLPRNVHPLVIGSQHIAESRRHRRRKIPRRVVVLSQGTIGRHLFRLARQAAALAGSWHFVFRPHPLESIDVYKALAESNPRLDNVSLSGNEEDLHELLASAEIQIGVFSTSLFEGMALGARTILVNLPGVEQLDRAVERGDAIVADSSDDIAAALLRAPAARNPDDYYSVPVDSIANAIARGSLGEAASAM